MKRINDQFATRTEKVACQAAKAAAHRAYESHRQQTIDSARANGYQMPAWVTKGNPYTAF